MCVFVNELAPSHVRSQQGQCLRQCRRIMKGTLGVIALNWGLRFTNMPVVHLLCLICVLCAVFVLHFAVPSCIALLYSILLCQLLCILCSIASGCVASCFVVFVSLVFLIVIGSLICGVELAGLRFSYKCVFRMLLEVVPLCLVDTDEYYHIVNQHHQSSIKSKIVTRTKQKVLNRFPVWHYQGNNNAPFI